MGVCTRVNALSLPRHSVEKVACQTDRPPICIARRQPPRAAEKEPAGGADSYRQEGPGGLLACRFSSLAVWLAVPEVLAGGRLERLAVLGSLLCPPQVREGVGSLPPPVLPLPPASSGKSVAWVHAAHVCLLRLRMSACWAYACLLAASCVPSAPAAAAASWLPTRPRLSHNPYPQPCLLKQLRPASTHPPTGAHAGGQGAKG